MQENINQMRKENNTISSMSSVTTFATNLLKSLIEQTPAIFAAIDTEFTIMDFNKSFKIQFQQVYGVDVEVNDNLLELLNHLPSERNKIKEIWGRALEGEEFSLVEEFGDLVEKTFEIDFKVIKDEHDNIIGAYQIVKDVTEITNIRDQLNKSEAMFRAFFDSSPFMMGIIDVEDNDIRHISDNISTGNFFGISPDKMRGKLATELGVSKEDLEKWLKHYRDAQNFKAPQGFEYRHQSKSGLRYLSAVVNLIEIKDSQFPVFSYIVQDITDMRQKEIELNDSKQLLEQRIRDRTLNLQKSQKNFERMFNLAPFAFAVMRKSTDSLVLVNEAWCKLTGIRRENAIGKSTTELKLFHNLNERDRLYDEFNKNGKVRNFELSFITTNQELRYLMVNLDVIELDMPGDEEQFILTTLEDVTKRKRAEANFLEERHRLTAVIINSPSVLSLKSVTGKYIIANPNYDKILGMDSSSLIGKTDFEIFPPSIAEKLRANDERVLESGERLSVEEIIPHSNGKQLIFMSHKFPITDLSGKIESVCSISLNITDSKTAQDRLKVSERKFSTMFDRAPFAIALLKASDKTIVDVNPAWVELMGVSKEDAVGKNSTELNIGMDPKERKLLYENFYKNKKIRNVESTLLTRTGKSIRVSTNLDSMDLEGETFVLASMVDINARWQAERSLQYQLQLMRTITDNAASCLFMLDKFGAPTFMNPAAKAVTGYESLDEIKSRPLHYAIHSKKPNGDFFPIEDCPIENAQYDLHFLQNKEEVFCRKDGSLFPVSFSVAPLQKDGETIGSVLEFRDITEEKKATQALIDSEERLKRYNVELEEALRARDDFLSIASHELKTPLSSLKLQLQLAKRNRDRGDVTVYSPEKVNRLIDQTERQTSRLIRLVDDMLDISRIRTGKLTIQREKFCLCTVVSDVLERLDANLREAGNQVILTCPGAIVGYWDRFRVEQVLTNLLTNAMKYGNRKPVTISIRLLPEDPGYVQLKVADQGIGLAPGAEERIFNQFERAVNANEVSGLGLGLFITQQIVVAHSGRIRAESEGPGKGTTFIVELPVYQNDENTNII